MTNESGQTQDYGCGEIKRSELLPTRDRHFLRPRAKHPGELLFRINQSLSRCHCEMTRAEFRIGSQLDFLREYGGLAPADRLRWRKFVVVNDAKMTLGCLHHFARRVTLEPK